MQGVIAIVGRPNVGKSALFNRIARRRIAIVHDQPGVTRDRVIAEVEWNGRPFTLIDTGGIGLLRGEKAADVITAAAFDQVQIALESAHVILLVVNIQEGVVPLDLEVAKRLHGTQKPVVVVVNKADNDRSEAGVIEFAALGFDQMLPVSAIHERGMGDLMDRALGFLPVIAPVEAAATDAAEGDADGSEPTAAAPKAKKPLRLAIVGRPNVGKSSIINKLTGSERVIVSPIPGTTRDAVDVPFEVDTAGNREKYVLVDTAGLRKARRVDEAVEHFSVERSKEAIARADIVVLVVDAESGIVEQDKKIADVITENKRACIIVVNKWDLVADKVREAQQQEFERREQKGTYGRPKQLVTLGEFGDWVREKLFFLDYAPVIFTSAKDGFQLDRLLEAVRYVAAQLEKRIPTSILNRTLGDAIVRRQPVSKLGHRLKFFYATQVREAPPSFLLFVNRDELFSPTYEKYLAGEIRRAFGYEGCPIVLIARARPKTIATIRRARPVSAERPSKGEQRTEKAVNISRKPRVSRGRPGQPGQPRTTDKFRQSALRAKPGSSGRKGGPKR